MKTLSLKNRGGNGIDLLLYYVKYLLKRLNQAFYYNKDNKMNSYI